MSEKHYPYIGGSFDRIIFDGDGSVWVPEPENAKLREVIDDITEVVEFSDPALVEFIAKRMERIRTEVGE